MSDHGRTAQITPDGLHRLRLDYWWAAGARLAWLMTNPSMATATVNDPTFLRVVHYTRLWGFPGLTIVNLFPLRTSSPAMVYAWAERALVDGSVTVGERLTLQAMIDRNLETIRDVSQHAAARVVAFGRVPPRHRELETYVEHCTKVFGGGRDLLCLCKNEDGSPTHPLARGRARVADNQQPRPWRYPRALEEIA